MKRIVLATAFAACVSYGPAQAADAAKAKCEPKPA